MKTEALNEIKGKLSAEQNFFRFWLQKQFTDRCKKNTQFSLRAFARSLEIDPSSLSQILSGKRKLSRQGTNKLCLKLSPTPKELELFGLTKKTITPAEEQYYQLATDTFAVISDWYHYAILELTYVADFKANSNWIARKLSIKPEEAANAIERLIRLGLLVNKNKSVIKSSKNLTNDGVVNTSAAHKEFQRQVLSKALHAIDQTPQEEKDISSITMAIDTKNLNKASLLIQKFRRDICELLEEGHRTQVYNLNVQLFPITKKENI